MAQIPTQVSQSTIRRNPHLYGSGTVANPNLVANVAKGAELSRVAAPSKRLRQDTKPLMNKLESEWFGILAVGKYEGFFVENLRAQAYRYRLGNGIWFRPDITCKLGARLTAFEVKGPKAFRGGFENLKVAAAQWPEWDWILVWKENGQWQKQLVLP